MFTKDTVVLDVTSSRVTAIVGCKKALSVYDIKARTERSYDGYADGEFFDADGAAEAMTSALCEAIDKTAVPAKRVYIGVPGEFVTLIDRPVTVTLDRVRRVVDADIDYLIAKGGRFDYAERVLIGSSPVCYTVDTSDRSFFDVRGMTAGKVSATVSYMLADRTFTDLAESAARRAGFRDVRFVATPWAECVAMFEREQRDAAYVVIDAGYLSSSVAVGRGEGLDELKSFSMGGGHVAADIYEVLGVPFPLAEEAKELVDLNLSQRHSRCGSVRDRPRQTGVFRRSGRERHREHRHSHLHPRLSHGGGVHVNTRGEDGAERGSRPYGGALRPQSPRVHPPGRQFGDLALHGRRDHAKERQKHLETCFQRR